VPKAFVVRRSSVRSVAWGDDRRQYRFAICCQYFDERRRRDLSNCSFEEGQMPDVKEREHGSDRLM
jgi:hypothetical protein